MSIASYFFLAYSYVALFLAYTAFYIIIHFPFHPVTVGFSQNTITVPENFGEGFDIEVQILDLTSEGEVDPEASLPLTLQLQEEQGESDNYYVCMYVCVCMCMGSENGQLLVLSRILQDLSYIATSINLRWFRLCCIYSKCGT